MKNFRFLVFVVSLFIFSYANASNFQEAHKLSLSSAESKMIVDVNLTKYEPRSGTATAQLTIIPPQNLIGPNFSLNQDMMFLDFTGVSLSKVKIKANEPFSVNDLFYYADYIVEDSGNEFYFPFDSHVFQINYGVFEKVGENYEVYPVVGDCSLCHIGGYNIDVQDVSKDSGKAIFNITLSKNVPSKVLAVGISFVLLFMGSLVLIMSIRTAADNKAPEMSALGFAGGLLFAFPSIRNAIPNVPPIGVLMDYFGMFPGELFVASALCILAVCWLRRGGSFKDAKAPDVKK